MPTLPLTIIIIFIASTPAANFVERHVLCFLCNGIGLPPDVIEGCVCACICGLKRNQTGNRHTKKKKATLKEKIVTCVVCDCLYQIYMYNAQ